MRAYPIASVVLFAVVLVLGMAAAAVVITVLGTSHMAIVSAQMKPAVMGCGIAPHVEAGQ